MTTDPSSRAARQRNARGEGSRLRSEILVAARELLATGEPLTLRSLARQAGIAAPSIYRHFPDLDAVMSALAESAYEALTAALVVRRDQEWGAVARLRGIARAYLDYARAEPHLYRLMFGGVWDAPLALERHPDEAERFGNLGLNAYAVLVDAVEACVAENGSDSVDAAQDAAALWVALHGYAQLRENARLFPWPPDIESTLVTQLARLR